MENVLLKEIIIGVSGVLFSVLVSLLVFTAIIGSNIAAQLQSEAISLYARPGSMVSHELEAQDSIEATNLYKFIELNRNSILDYKIFNKSGTIIVDYNYLLKIPSRKFKVEFDGDTTTGFKLVARQMT